MLERLGWCVARENQQSNAAEKKSPFIDSFQTTDIDIEAPLGVKDIQPGTFTVPGLLYQNLTAVIQAVFSSPLASHFHFSPFKLFHRSSNGKKGQVFSKLYNSDIFITEYNNVQHAPLLPNELDCRWKKVVAALMFWSDSTHLADFGTTKLWPIYLLYTPPLSETLVGFWLDSGWIPVSELYWLLDNLINTCSRHLKFSMVILIHVTYNTKVTI